jgi:uncharacterized protein
MTHSPTHLVIFFSLTFVWSWTCWLLTPIVKADSSYISSALFFLGGFGPSLAAVTLVAMTGGRAGLRAWLARCLRWRGNWGWMVLAFLSPLAVLTLAAAMHMALGGSVRPSPAMGHVALFIANFGLVFLVGGPLGEEFGWRGYALPAMQERLGWRSASLSLGAIWGVWHLPLFFVAGSSQNQGSVLAFFVLIVATSVIYAWFFNRAKGSVLPALVLHTASNAWPFLVPVLPSDTDQRPYLLVVGLVVTVCVWLLLRRDGTQTLQGLPS